MITSLSNEKIKEILKLKYKTTRENALFLVDGFHLIEEAIRSNQIIEILTSNNKIEGTLVSQDIIKKLSSSVTPQGVIGVVRKPQPREIGPRVLVLDFIQDPGNVGSLIRSAVAFNWDTVIVKGASPFSPKAIQASQGAIFHINIIETNDLAPYLKDTHHTIIVADKREHSEVYSAVKVPKSIMLVLGNEGKGVSAEVSGMAHKTVYIPVNYESLNVAAAGAILLNSFAK